jgi:hypothetical protein
LVHSRKYNSRDPNLSAKLILQVGFELWRTCPAGVYATRINALTTNLPKLPLLNWVGVIKFEFEEEVNDKNMIVWNVTLCSLVDRYRRFGDTYNLHLKLDD